MLNTSPLLRKICVPACLSRLKELWEKVQQASSSWVHRAFVPILSEKIKSSSKCFVRLSGVYAETLILTYPFIH